MTTVVNDPDFQPIETNLESLAGPFFDHALAQAEPVWEDQDNQRRVSGEIKLRIDVVIRRAKGGGADISASSKLELPGLTPRGVFSTLSPRSRTGFAHVASTQPDLPFGDRKEGAH